MKRLYVSILGLAFLGFSLFAQFTNWQFRYSSHAYKAGQDVQFQILNNNIVPGDAGIDRYWDFSDVENIDKNLTSFMLQASQLKNASLISDADFAIEEFGNQFFFEFTSQSMEHCGTVTSYGVVIKYNQRPLKFRFPMGYGDHYFGDFSGEQISSRGNVTKIKGRYDLSVDSYGTIVLPDGQVFENTLRLRTERIRIYGKNEYSTITYRWYVEHVKYPIFVIIQSKSNNKVQTIQTAFQMDVPEPENPLNAKLLINDDAFFSVYPNPFSDNILHVTYTVEKDSKVTIDLYDLNGRKVQSIIGNELQKEGSYTIDFTSETNLPSGVYYIRANIGGKLSEQKVVKTNN